MSDTFNMNVGTKKIRNYGKEKILLLIASVIVSVGMNAQGIEIYNGSTLEASYTGFDYKAVLKKTPTEVYSDSKLNTNTHLVQAWFSVSPTKKVQFTNANLYWTGSAWAFETDQITCPNNSSSNVPSEWNTSHVSHFHWAKAASVAYTKDYSDGENAVSDKFFADGSDTGHQLTVDNLSGLYVLSSAEWSYLFGNSTERAGKCKWATVGDICCLVIAPDNFSGTLESTYTLEAANTAGLVCLPAAGYWTSSGSVYDAGSSGYYWSATPSPNNTSIACSLYFSDSYVIPPNSDTYRDNGFPIRLVRGL